METQSDFSSYTYSEKPSFNHEMFNYYKDLIKLRKSETALTYGTYLMLPNVNNDEILAYERAWKGEKLLIVINNHNEANAINLDYVGNEYQIVFRYNNDLKSINQSNILPPFSGIVLKVK